VWSKLKCVVRVRCTPDFTDLVMRERGIKDSSGGGEFKYDIFDTL
jgi:hypothetical protein